MPKSSAISTRTSLPGVSDLISQSWATLMRNAGTMVMVWVIGILAYALIGFLVAMLALITGGVLVGTNANFFQNLAQAGTNWPHMLAPAAGGFGLFVLVVMLIFAVVASALEASIIYAASQMKKRVSVSEAITMGKQRALPLLGVSIVSGLITFGGLFLLVIPGIVFGVLFCMAVYEVVLGETNVWKALTTSASLVKNHFWDVLGRVLVLIGIGLVIMISAGLVKAMLQPMIGSASALVISSLLRLVLNIGFSLFVVTYMTTLYRQLKAAPSVKKMSLLWVVALSAVGWLFAILILGSLVAVVGRVVQQWPQLLRDNPNLLQDAGGNEADWNMMMHEFDASPEPSMMPLATAAPSPRGIMNRQAPVKY